MPRALAILLGLCLLATLAWWWPNRPRDAGPTAADARFNSVSFAPFRAGQSPLRDRFPTAAEVEADVALLAPRVRALRTYAAVEGDYDVAEIAARHGLKLWQGVWLGTNLRQNERELERAIALANRHPETVERVVVGNEVLLRRDLPPDRLIDAIRRVRAAVRQPVTYADVWEFWEQYPQVAAHVDIVTIHILPYWEDEPLGVDAAVAHTADIVRRIQARFPGKPVAIGEIGWPSRGRSRADAVPSRVNQAVFLRRVMALAAQEGFDWNLIEAFDQGWKYQHEGTVGAAWGLLTEDRAAKFPLADPVAEQPAWPWYAAAGVACSLALFALGRRRAPPGRTAVVAVLAVALGQALAVALAGTLPVIHDRHLLLAAAVNLPAQALLAWLLLRRLGASADTPALPYRPAAASTAALRAALRGRRAGVRGFEDLTFCFLWAAVLLQWLLVLDPRYRDFPVASFAVPIVAVLFRAALRDHARVGGGWPDLALGGLLAAGALLGALREGPLNLAALGWSAAALVLAWPALRAGLHGVLARRPDAMVPSRIAPSIGTPDASP